MTTVGLQALAPIENRCVGAILGLAVGDALGATYESMAHTPNRDRWWGRYSLVHRTNSPSTFQRSWRPKPPASFRGRLFRPYALCLSSHQNLHGALVETLPVAPLILALVSPR